MPTLPRASTPRELQKVIAAEQTGVPFLLYRGGEEELWLHALEGELVTVGRASEANVSLGWDPGVSLLHADLIARSGSWLIADDGISRNGTFVNGERVQGRQRLRAGDTILVGHTTLVFHEGAAA